MGQSDGEGEGNQQVRERLDLQYRKSSARHSCRPIALLAGGQNQDESGTGLTCTMNSVLSRLEASCSLSCVIQMVPLVIFIYGCQMDLLKVKNYANNSDSRLLVRHLAGGHKRINLVEEYDRRLLLTRYFKHGL